MQLLNAYAQYKGGTRSLKHADTYSIDLTLDILRGCQHKCPGCFVNRNLKFINQDLYAINNLVEQWHYNNFDFNELFVGPTDIFNASNFEQLVKNKHFQQLSTKFTFTCTTTCLNDFEVTKNRLSMLNDYCSNWAGRNFEVFVILDLPKYINRDKQYLDQFNKNLQLLYNDNVFFLLNIYSENMFDEVSLYQLNTRLKQEYNAKIRINPSYFRATKNKHVLKNAMAHKNMLQHQINDDTIKHIFLNMLDMYFGGFTFGNYALINHELYICPLLYEAIPITNNMVQIAKSENNLYNIDNIHDKHIELFNKQHQYAQHLECKKCKYLTSCISRNVLSYMETRNIQQCFLPKQLFRDASKIIQLENR